MSQSPIYLDINNNKSVITALKAGEKSFRIKKYKAIILQGKKNDVEALKWYRLAFEYNGTDEFVID